jgi:hypothetical protein
MSDQAKPVADSIGTTFMFGFPYRGRRYRIWWRGFSGRVHRFSQLVCWDGECRYYIKRNRVRVILCPAHQQGIERWKFACKKAVK